MIDGLNYFGATHKTSAVAIREKLAVSRERLPEFLRVLRGGSAEAVVLSTCGRFEVYWVADDSGAGETIRGVSELLRLDADWLREHAGAKRGAEVAAQALRVAAGLESQLVGEPQILSQVRDAFLTAADCGATGPMLSALFRAAIHTGRRVRNETSLGKGEMDFGMWAVEQLRRYPGEGGAREVVVLGSGALARSVAAALGQFRDARCTFVSRHFERAMQLARKFGGAARDMGGLPELLASADAVIGCAAAAGPLISREDARVAAELRGGRELLLVDLGMPRNVAPEAATVSGVTLRQLDDVEKSAAGDGTAVRRAERIVAEECRRYRQWVGGRLVIPRIVDLMGTGRGGDRRLLHESILRIKQEAAA